jgi:Chaperone of endosialidase
MKTCQARSILAVSIFAGLAISGVANAITLPDTTSPCTVGTNGTCFKITNGASNGTAIWGNTTNTTGYGLFGSGNYGVQGWASTSTGYGVVGIANSAVASVGVYGTTSIGTGVYGVATSFGHGVIGTAGASGNGVSGTSVGNGIGVYGENTDSTGWAAYFNGKAFVTSGTWSGSDARLKKDITDAPYGLTALSRLRPVTYKWKKDGADGGTQIGLIAQEVQKVVPEVVLADGTSGMLSINYTALLPVMIKAVQEQQKTIEQQNSRIALLERKRAPMMSSLFSGDLGAALALGLVPLGLIAAKRRKHRE